MNRLKNFVEWNAFGVCSSIGDRLHISPCRIRQYFIYSSVLTMGSPIIVYMVLAFWKNMKNFFETQPLVLSVRQHKKVFPWRSFTVLPPVPMAGLLARVFSIFFKS